MDYGDSGDVRIFDPVAGGEVLLVIDVGQRVNALAAFADPATGELRLACGCRDGKARIFDPVAGGEALVVLEGHTGNVFSFLGGHQVFGAGGAQRMATYGVLVAVIALGTTGLRTRHSAAAGGALVEERR